MASDTTDGELEHGNRFNRQNGHLFCENVRIKTIQSTLDNLLDQPSPCFIYSEGRIRDNVDAYLSALEDSGIPYMLGYALKANYNPAVLAVMKDMGCAAVTVSGNEVKLALQAGVSPEKIIFNGNGKQLWEVALAVAQGCLINVDSAFDLRHIVQEVTRQNKTAIIFVRINPDINAVSDRTTIIIIIIQCTIFIHRKPYQLYLPKRPSHTNATHGPRIEK